MKLEGWSFFVCENAFFILWTLIKLKIKVYKKYVNQKSPLKLFVTVQIIFGHFFTDNSINQAQIYLFDKIFVSLNIYACKL
jgi:hypothetical protein